MPKPSPALSSLPPIVLTSLALLGENLSIARKRRRESQALWAQRLGVSIPTLKRMECGDPGVAVGIYATALWLIGRADALGPLADPAQDHGALEMAVRQAQKRSARQAVTQALP